MRDLYYCPVARRRGRPRSDACLPPKCCAPWAERYDHRLRRSTRSSLAARPSTRAASRSRRIHASWRANESHAVFLGAVGGPKWERGARRPEQGLLELRKALGLFANIRPVRIYDDLHRSAPHSGASVVADVDLVIFRELTGGLYFR